MNYDEAFEFFKKHNMGFFCQTPSYMKYRGWYFLMQGVGNAILIKEDLSEVHTFGSGVDFLFDGVDYAQRHV